MHSPANNGRDLALIGAGYWGKNLARNFHALESLHTICDANEATLAAYGAEYSAVSKVSQFAAVLQNPVITKVAIAAPAAAHYELVKRALEAGKDVFVEKPLCLGLREAAELGQLAVRCGRILMVGHLLQYHPCIQTILQLVATGELGKLQYITSNRLNLGKIRHEENSLWSFAPHDISVILALAGGRLPEQVRCMGGAYLNEGVSDTTLTALKFAGGVRAHIYVSWINPFKEQKLTVVGSHGMIVFDDTRPWREKLLLFTHYLIWDGGQVPTPNKALGRFVEVPEAEPLREECAHFLACCRERRPPRTDAAEGLRVLEVLDAAQRSLDGDGDAVHPGRGTPSPAPLPYYAHPTAIVDPGAELGEGTKVWHFAHISGGARIGRKCIFGQNTFVADGVKIGSNVKVQNNVAIYTGTTIEDDVFLGPSCVLTNVTNPRSQINRHSLYEPTLIRRGATIGANATIVCGVTLGRYCFISASALVAKDVPDYALMVGVPARQKGWMSRHGHRLTPAADGVMRCPESGLTYVETPPGVLRCIEVEEEAQLPAEMSVGQRTYDQLKSKSGSPL